MIDNAFYVGEKVAIRYNQPAPKYIKIGEKDYVFSCEHSVSLAFVDEADVQPLLDFMGGCCGKRQHIFSLAAESSYRHWLTGDR